MKTLTDHPLTGLRIGATTELPTLTANAQQALYREARRRGIKISIRSLLTRTLVSRIK